MLNKNITIRFYEELNDFLSPEKRKVTYQLEYTKKRSVKDLIESQGVPHTEISLILVNSQPVSLNYLVKPGDRVSVYPVFETLDIKGTTKIAYPPLRNPKFVADVHLGKLVRHLRLIGFDCLYDKNFGDEELAEISSKENRILLTRDVGLLKRAIITHGLFIRSDDPYEQLQEIIRRLNLQQQAVPFSRCVNCNGSLTPVKKEHVKALVPIKTYRYFEDFVQCNNCGQVFWKGAHWERIQKIIEQGLQN